MKQLAAIVLGFEAIVVGLATPVLISVSHLNTTLALIWGLGDAVLCVVAAALVRQSRIGFVLGWAVQVIAIAMGVVTTTMFVVGGLFTVLWVVALRLGSKMDAVRRPDSPAS